MKKLIFIILTLLPFTLKAPNLSVEYYRTRSYNYLLKEYITNKEIELNKFLFQLSLRESSHRWNITNTLGYIGKYQFGKQALKAVGYNISYKKFKADPYIFPEEHQEIAIRTLIDINSKTLEKHIYMYENSTIKGIFITKSGLLAAAHLAGAYNVKKFLESKGTYDTKDKYGTKLTDYLNEFKNYKF